jgi:hypothetical protein
VTQAKLATLHATAHYAGNGNGPGRGLQGETILKRTRKAREPLPDIWRARELDRRQRAWWRVAPVLHPLPRGAASCTATHAKSLELRCPRGIPKLRAGCSSHPGGTKPTTSASSVPYDAWPVISYQRWAPSLFGAGRSSSVMSTGDRKGLHHDLRAALNDDRVRTRSARRLCVGGDTNFGSGAGTGASLGT